MSLFLRQRCLLPYTQLEYIEGVPTFQVIDTGQPLNYDTVFVSFKWNLFNTGSHVNYVPIFGTYISETDPCFRLILNNYDWTYRININNNGNKSAAFSNAMNSESTVNTLTVGSLSGSKYADYNSHSDTFTLVNEGLTNSNNCFIGECRNYAIQSSTYANYKLRIYYFRISVNNVLTRNMIPCKYNGQIGMYDKVTNQFFGNAGVGNFTAGPEI